MNNVLFVLDENSVHNRDSQFFLIFTDAIKLTYHSSQIPEDMYNQIHINFTLGSQF